MPARDYLQINTVEYPLPGLDKRVTLADGRFGLNQVEVGPNVLESSITSRKQLDTRDNGRDQQSIQPCLFWLHEIRQSGSSLVSNGTSVAPKDIAKFE